MSCVRAPSFSTKHSIGRQGYVPIEIYATHLIEEYNI